MSDVVQEYIARQPHSDKRRKFLHPLLSGLVNLLCDLEVTGLEHVPDSGSSVLMINHITFLDPALITAKIKNRYVISMGKAELSEHWLTRIFVTLWDNFPVHREQVDRAALNNAMRLLESGRMILMAPEGKRNPDGMHEARGGVSYVAFKTGAIIIPAAVCGVLDWTQRLKSLKRVKGTVTFGRPFRFKLPEGQRLTREIREQMMQEAMYQLALAMPEKYAWQRGVYSDIENATTEYLEFL